MITSEQLALSGATTLLTYLQCARLTDEGLGANALAAALCELLNQLETIHPGVASDYGWQRVAFPAETAHFNNLENGGIDADQYSDFDLSSLS